MEMKYLLMGHYDVCLDWARQHNIEPHNWAYLNPYDMWKLQGIEGPNRDIDSPWVVVRLRMNGSQYPVELYDLLAVRGF